MFQTSLLYAILLLVAAGVSLTACGTLWTRRSVSGAFAMFVFMGALGIWSLSYALFWISLTPESQTFWLNATYFGVVLAPPSFIIFTLHFTHHESWINRKTLFLLTVEPAITLILLWTDPVNGLFFEGKRLASSSAFLDGSLLFWLNVVYIYVLILVVSTMLFRYRQRARAPFRQQTSMMLVGILFPWIGSVISLAKLDPLPNLDLTPFLFILTGLIVTYALFYNRLFDLIPIARDWVFETMHEPVFVLDMQNRILDVNPSGLQLVRDVHKPAIDTFMGMPIQTFFPFDDTWVPDETAQREMQIKTDSQVLFYEYRLSQLRDTRGNEQGKVLVLNNVTRRKQVQQRELEIKLEKERVHLLAEFIKDASHEFRTPLAAINSTAYLMARLDDAEKRAEKNAQILQYVNRITGLIDMMLSITSIDTMLQDPKPVNVNEVLHHVCSGFPKSTQQASVTCDVAPNLPPINGFSTYLQMAITQVIDNAVRYTPVNGQVTVRAFQTGTCMVIEVQDTGSGIAEVDLPYIFDSFWRKDAAHSTPGLGLGLSIAQKVVQAHKGVIEVESNLGKGSLFRLRFPVAA